MKPFPESSRLLSLDVFRGITIALMIVVNSPGDHKTYAWLEHSAWDGCTFADLVFPFFVFILGVSSVFTLSKLRKQGLGLNPLLGKIVKRSVFLFGIGLLLNAISLHMDWGTLRLLGVLQRIALCYCCSAILYLTTRLWTQALIALFILIGYWLLMVFIAVPGYGAYNLTLEGNLVAFIDKLLIPTNHLYHHGFDPEGLFSTLPAIATALMGNILGACLQSPNNHKTKLTLMIIVGAISAGLGWLWGLIFPINKALWSSSYVLWTSGLALLTFACCYSLIEIKHWKKWAWPFKLFGLNALSAYTLHVLFLKIQAMILIPVANAPPVNLRVFITHACFGWATMENASLLYALCYTLLWLALLALMDSKRSNVGDMIRI